MKHRKFLHLLAAGMLAAVMVFTGCSNNGDPQEKIYKTSEDAIAGMTREDQELLTQIEARDGKVIAVWNNIGEESTLPFSIALFEKDGEEWKVTDKSGVTMNDKFSGAGLYPVKDPLIDYAVSPYEDDPVAGSYANHKSAHDWAFHWTIVPELPA